MMIEVFRKVARRHVALAALLALGQVGGVLPALAAQDEPVAAGEEAEVTFSEAERVLWMTDQLAKIDSRVVLRYEFSKGGVYEAGFDDTVDLRILEARDDGMKHAAVTFFTGERNQFVPENESTNVNPVLGLYLQGDVYEMDRLTDGHWRYFHRRLKFGFADVARVEPVTFEFDGRAYEGKRVTMQPFLDDPKRAEMGVFAFKGYSIIVSDELPGYLYEIQTLVPPEQEGGEVLMHERLRLVSIKPLES